MAFVDNKEWLLNFIRTQFIISDDTGICEATLGPECGVEEPESPFPGAHLDHEQLCNSSLIKPRAPSPDIFLNMDAKSRRRSNTAVRLEKIRKDREEKSRVRISHWSKSDFRLRGQPVSTDEDPKDIFKKVQVPAVNGASKTSALTTKLLEAHHKTETGNPFDEFARYDGRAFIKGNAKSLTVYIYRAGSRKPIGQKYGVMSVCVIQNARVMDVIGLICWQYTSENQQPALRDSTDYYSLFLAEDNGEIDTDLPAMDSSEPFSRFGGVDHVALVEHEIPIRRAISNSVVVRINLVEGSFSKLVVDTMDSTLREILDKVLRKRNMPFSVRGLEYTLEKKDEPGVPVDLEQTIGSVRCLEYYLVRGNSKNPAISVNSGGSSSQSKS